MKKILLSTLVFVISFICSINAEIYHVKKDGNDNNNGLSWQNSFVTIQKALNIAKSSDEIWVAEGLYHPTYDYNLNIGDRGKHFRLKSGVAIYGGFSNTGNPGFEEKKPLINKTIICGDLKEDDYWNEQTKSWDNRNDNCYHLFYHPINENFKQNTILDGFTIQNGNANDADSVHIFGGAIFNNENDFQINNCILKNNFAFSGGAIESDNSYLIINNSYFLSNIALNSGGGICALRSKLNITNCVIAENTAMNVMGGGIYAYFTLTKYSEMEIINCTITNNISKSPGGGILIGSQTQMDLDFDPGNTYIFNTILYGNKSQELDKSNELYVAYTGSGLGGTNTGKTTLDYCLLGSGISSVSGGIDEKYCLKYTDPQFVSIGENPYSIKNNSSCIDNGNNDYVNEEYDIRGKGYLRKLNGKDGKQDGLVDIGAYEFNFNIDDVEVKETDFQNNISVYPNPAGDYIEINLETFDPTLKRGVDEGYDIQIFDMLGINVSLAGGRIKGGGRINISNLSPGMYFIKIGNKVEKFVKM
jgi:hypothetical protein